MNGGDGAVRGEGNVRQLRWAQGRMSRASSGGGPRDETHVAAPLSLISSFQAPKKVLMADLSGSQDQNKHDVKNLRLTALEDGQENYPLGKVNMRMPLDAARGFVSHLDGFWKHSLPPRPLA